MPTAICLILFLGLTTLMQAVGAYPFFLVLFFGFSCGRVETVVMARDVASELFLWAAAACLLAIISIALFASGGVPIR